MRAEKKTHKLSPEDVESVLQLRRDGVSAAEIARRFGISRPSVDHHLRSAGLETSTVKQDVLTEAERDEIVRRRTAGESVGAICATTGKKLSTVRWTLAKAGVRVTPEQHRLNMREHAPEVDAAIIERRRLGETRASIALALGVPMSKVKDVLRAAGIVLPLGVRQANAEAGQAPGHMERMRAALTPEVLSCRAESIRRRYSEDAALRGCMGEISKAWWASLTPEDRGLLAQSRCGPDSIRVRGILASEGHASMAERCSGWAASLGGEFVGPYTHSHMRATWRCSRGHEFEMQPYVVGNGSWCPRCAHVGPSAGELEVRDFVAGLGVPFRANDRTAISPMELDLWFPERKFAVEYDGLIYHSSWADHMRGRHWRKWRLCADAGISLFAIFADEWRDRRTLVEAMIRRRLGVAEVRIVGARELRPVKLEKNSDFEAFFEKNHLDGHAQASHAHALLEGDRIVACASFRRNFAGEDEIARFATDMDLSVPGALGKMLSMDSAPRA
jgi:AcrR family transcriptional regulator